EPSIDPPNGRCGLLRPLERNLTEDLVDLRGADLLSGLQLPHRLVDLALLALELRPLGTAGLAAELGTDAACALLETGLLVLRGVLRARGGSRKEGQCESHRHEEGADVDLHRRSP